MEKKKCIDKQMALYEKEKGNAAFKNSKYSEAVELYSRAIDLDSTLPVLFCNRAMAYLKLKKFLNAKCDCDQALHLDPTYVKAFFRRGLSNAAINDLDSALADFHKILKLEPDNKEAVKEIEKVHEFISNQPENALQIEPLKELPSNYIDSKQQPINVERVGGASTATNEIPAKQAASNEFLDHAHMVVKENRPLPSSTHRTTNEKVSGLSHAPFCTNRQKESPEPKRGPIDQNPPTLLGHCHPSTKKHSHAHSVMTNHKAENGKPTDDSKSETADDCPSCVVTRKKAAAARLLTQAALDEQKSISAMMTSLMFDAPKSAFQFLNGWRSLKGDRRKFFLYLMKIPAKNYIEVVDSCLEPELVTDILSAYSEHGFPASVNEENNVGVAENFHLIFDSLSMLSQLKNFKTCKLFFDAKDIAKLDSITERLKMHGDFNEQDLKDLKKRFET